MADKTHARIFMAPYTIEPGSISNEEIKSNIELCDIFITILSPESIKSSFSQQEIDIVINEKKSIFPIRL